MAFCPSCGKPVPEDVAFCPSCGFSLTTVTGAPNVQPQMYAPPSSVPPAQPVSTAPPSGKGSHTLRNIGIIVLVVIVVIVILAGLGATRGGGGGVLPQQHTQNIVNGLITVGARSYNDYQFSVPSSASGASISGSFTASGGGGNDVIVIVMDSTNFVNWQNGHQYSAYYYSGQLTTSNINANLPAGGTYYLVYSNQFSFLTSKNVQTTVDLTYTS